MQNNNPMSPPKAPPNMGSGGSKIPNTEETAKWFKIDSLERQVRILEEKVIHLMKLWAKNRITHSYDGCICRFNSEGEQIQWCNQHADLEEKNADLEKKNADLEKKIQTLQRELEREKLENKNAHWTTWF